MTWPAIPDEILTIWQDLTGADRQPDCCLINYYGEGTKMGLHQDKDEADFSWPVLSISLGDDALFRIGNTTRGGKTESIWLSSGDVVIMGGPARLTYHGVDRIRFGSSKLLPKGGRINLTLRVATVKHNPNSGSAFQDKVCTAKISVAHPSFSRPACGYRTRPAGRSSSGLSRPKARIPNWSCGESSFRNTKPRH